MFNWLSTVFPRRNGLRPAPHIAAVATRNTMNWPNLAEAEAQARLYQQSPWVYIAVSRIAEAAALVPLRVHPRLSSEFASLLAERGLGGEVHHPLESLLDAPNPYMSRFELMEQTLGMLELTGDAYWFLGGDGSGTPTEIWPLRPDRVSIVPDPVDYVKGYVYELDGQRIPLMPVEVIHFKRWHPNNDYYGLSALEAARLAVTSDHAMAEWNRNTFGQDSGVPAGIVNIKEKVNDADYERVKREWRQSYGGPQRRTAFLRGGSIEWQNIGLNHNELDFLQGRRAHRDEILNIFGVPVGMVSENATEANAKVAERLFIERTLWPKLVRLSQKITQDLLPFWPGNYVAEFDDIRPTDVQARLDEIKTAYPVMSINEIRERYYRLPATLWGQMPVGAQKQLTDGPQPTTEAAPPATDTLPPAQSSKFEPVPLTDTLLANESDPEAAAKELDQWERFALKRLGKAQSRAFEVRHLPSEIAFELSAHLLAATTATDIQSAFAAARISLSTTNPSIESPSPTDL
ncbi:MAG: phage portal protein [Anaerolineaceae bacterium]|nr:phage portal protein [Anaerolineaceae bacterium]